MVAKTKFGGTLHDRQLMTDHHKSVRTIRQRRRRREEERASVAELANGYCVAESLWQLMPRITEIERR